MFVLYGKDRNNLLTAAYYSLCLTDDFSKVISTRPVQPEHVTQRSPWINRQQGMSCNKQRSGGYFSCCPRERTQPLASKRWQLAIVAGASCGRASQYTLSEIFCSLFCSEWGQKGHTASTVGKCPDDQQQKWCTRTQIRPTKQTYNIFLITTTQTFIATVFTVTVTGTVTGLLWLTVTVTVTVIFCWFWVTVTVTAEIDQMQKAIIVTRVNLFDHSLWACMQLQLDKLRWAGEIPGWCLCICESGEQAMTRQQLEGLL